MYCAGSDFPVTKTELTLRGTCSDGATVASTRIFSEGAELQPRVFFCSKNRKSRWNLVFIEPSEPVIECHREVRDRAT
jgi:hypothetical protein